MSRLTELSAVPVSFVQKAGPLTQQALQTASLVLAGATGTESEAHFVTSIGHSWTAVLLELAALRARWEGDSLPEGITPEAMAELNVGLQDSERVQGSDGLLARTVYQLAYATCSELASLSGAWTKDAGYPIVFIAEAVEVAI